MSGEIRTGFYTDLEEGFVGGGILADLDGGWDFNPNLEWVFVDRFDYVTLNADFHKDLNAASEPAIWLGAGVALLF